jgi:hypothetical protein
MFVADLTADQLKEVLHFDPDTGQFTWLKRTAKCVHVGDVAGAIDRKGYITIGFNRKIYKSHRLAWLYVTGEWPNGLIDHINGNKSDNRFCNLRVVNESGNSQNVRKPNRRNQSGFMGVIRFQNKWRASITINRKTYCIGDFKTPEEAHAAYLDAKRKSHAACTI